MPHHFKFFKAQYGKFSAFWELILLQLNCLSYKHKPRLWLIKPAIASLCVKEVGRLLHDSPPT